MPAPAHPRSPRLSDVDIYVYAELILKMRSKSLEKIF